MISISPRAVVLVFFSFSRLATAYQFSVVPQTPVSCYPLIVTVLFQRYKRARTECCKYLGGLQYCFERRYTFL